MIRFLTIAAALALPAVPAMAQTLASATPGALAGRSPHTALYDTSAKAECGKQMHSLPAGKLPTYGTHALGAAACQETLAKADTKVEVSRTAAD